MAPSWAAASTGSFQSSGRAGASPVKADSVELCHIIEKGLVSLWSRFQARRSFAHLQMRLAFEREIGRDEDRGALVEWGDGMEEEPLAERERRANVEHKCA
jgi:hypothetical protein